jgi:hypothetical protein
MPSRARAETVAVARSDLVDLLRKNRVPNPERTIERWLAEYRQERERVPGARETAAARQRQRRAVTQTLSAVRRLQSVLTKLEAAGMGWAPLYPKTCFFDIVPQALQLERISRPWTSQEEFDSLVREILPASLWRDEADVLATLSAGNRLTRVRDELAHLEACMVTRQAQPKLKRQKFGTGPIISLACAVATSLRAAGVPLHKGRDSVFARCLMLASTIAGDASAQRDQLYLIRLAAEGGHRNNRNLRLMNLSRAQER